MRVIAALLLAGPMLAGCVTAEKNMGLSCTEFIGQPVSHLIERQGQPQSTVKISETQSGYVYTATRRSYTPSVPYYTVNYMTRVDNRRSVSRPVTVTCSGIYVVLAQPGQRQMIIDVWPMR